MGPYFRPILGVSPRDLLCRFSVTHAVNTAPATKICTKRCQFSRQKYCTCQANQTRRGDSKVSAKQRAFCEKGICILCCNSGSRPCELGAKQTIFRMSLAASKQASRQPRGHRNCNKAKNVRMRENFRGKPRRLKLEQMHMKFLYFEEVSPSLKGQLQLYALHGPMFLFVDRLDFSLSPLGLFPN